MEILNLTVDYLCTCVEDVGVDSLSPLGVGIEDLEFDGGLTTCVGDIRANGVSSFGVGDTNKFASGLVTCVEGVFALATNVANLLQQMMD